MSGKSPPSPRCLRSQSLSDILADMEALVQIRFDRRVTVLAGTCLMACLLTGCVFIRLVRLKSQLADFSEHLMIEDHGGPTVTFKDPILRPGDLVWLFGLYPSVTTNNTHGYVFRKVRKGDGDGSAEDDIALTFRYKNNRLKSATMPVRFAPFITEDHFREIFSPLKNLPDVAAKGEQTEWNWRNVKVGLPNRASLLRYLGAPTRESNGSQGVLMQYQYRLDAPREQHETLPALDLTFCLPDENAHVSSSEARLGRLTVAADLIPGQNHVKIARGKQP